MRRLAFVVWSLAAVLLLAAYVARPAEVGRAVDPPDPGAHGVRAAIATLPGETCPAPVQPELDAAPEGATVVLPPCVIRETLAVTRPMTLRGVPGTEVRGSDVWTDWERDGGGWRSAQALPAMPAHGECLPGTTRCLEPEQVVRDGLPLEQVDAEPGPGAFTVDADRHVRLGADPAGHVVEVSIRS